MSFLLITEVIEQHVKETVEPYIRGVQDRKIFLKEMESCWQSHCRQMIMIRSIFLYLDRRYVLQTPSIPSIWYEVNLIIIDDCHSRLAPDIETLRLTSF